MVSEAALARKKRFVDAKAEHGGDIAGLTKHIESLDWNVWHEIDGTIISMSKEWNEDLARFGAVVIGARKILVAYNVNVAEKDAKTAKFAGSLVRTTGRLLKQDDGRKTRIPGMLPMVQGMGLSLENHGISQVSMNLRDVSITPMHIAYEAVKSIVNDHGVDTCGSELVGLVPLSAMIESGKWYATEDCSNEDLLVSAAIEGLGLDFLSPFNPHDRIIEWALKKEVAQ